ncbi:MAG: spermidine/putrescine ABC transporter substrate-binding protein [Anaerolineae bacterium]|nr:spermidine/putrescine ABC transporter substrate-binding protein [Anaerolineae bacterium]
MKSYQWMLLALLLALVVLPACGAATTTGGGGQPATEPEEAAAPTEAPAESIPPTEAAVPAEPAEEAAAPSAEGAAAGLDKELSVFNWADYIDEQVIKDYEETYGVKIIYDTFASNEDLIAKLQAGATGYDVIFPSGQGVAQVIELGLVAKLDHNNIPNLKNIDPKFLDSPDDPGSQYCAPYQWGSTGIAYRKDVFGDTPPDSWAYIFDPEQAKKWQEAGGINVLNDQRELIGAALKYLGYSVNDMDEAHLQEAKEVILKAKPFFKSFNSEDYDESLLVPGEVVISHAWNGDAAQAASKTIDEASGESPWAYIIPKEGSVIYQDGICVTASSPRKATAEHFINHLLDAKNGAAITNYTYYASPNAAAREFILPEILNDPGIYPSQEVIDKLEYFKPLGEAIFLYDQIWTEIKSQ